MMVQDQSPAHGIRRAFVFEMIFLDYMLGSAVRNDRNWNVLEAVKTLRISVSPASKGLCPFESCEPFKKGSILNFFDYFSDDLRTYARVFTFDRATQNLFCSIHSTLLILSVKDKIGSVAELVPQYLFYLIVFVRQGQIR